MTNDQVSAPLRGLALLDAAIEQIKDHPESWQQDDFRCSTGMCMGGWISELGGGAWLISDDLDSLDAWYLIAEDEDDRAFVFRAGDYSVITAAARAERLIGAPHMFFDFRDGYERTNLFSGGNELHDILRIRDEIAGWFASQE